MKPTFVFIGISCSGKSILSKRFATGHALSRIDVIDFVLPYVPALDLGEMTSQEMLDFAYREFFEELEKEAYDVIEIASDDPETHVPQIARILKTQGRRMMLIFTDASLDECMARNWERPPEKQVPYEAMEHQAEFGRAFFLNLRNRIDCMLMYSDTSSARTPDQSYAQFLRVCGEFKRFGLL